jgi:peroxiredoxin
MSSAGFREQGREQDKTAAGTVLPPDEKLTAALAGTRTESGRTLLELADEQPLLLVFLRHFGCTFCRQAIDDVSRVKEELGARGVRPVFIHVGTPERAKPYFDYYGLSDVERVSDPEARLYRSPGFALARTHPLSHFLLPSAWKGWLSGALFKHGFGVILREDAYQMPGAFFVKDRRVERAYRCKRISDRPDYLGLVSSAERTLRR